MNKLESISIVKIQPVSFQINEHLELVNPNDDLNVNFDIGFEFHENGKVMSFTIGITFNKKDDKTKVYSSCAVRTFFKLQFENKKLTKDSQVHIDKQSLITMLSLSISHTRAIMATYTNGTTHQSLIVPIINPTALFTDTLEKNLKKSIDEEFNAEIEN